MHGQRISQAPGQGREGYDIYTKGILPLAENHSSHVGGNDQKSFFNELKLPFNSISSDTEEKSLTTGYRGTITVITGIKKQIMLYVHICI